MSRRRSILLAGLLLALAIVVLYGLILRPEKEKEIARLRKEIAELEEAIGIAKVQSERLKSVLQRVLDEGSPVYLSQGAWKETSAKILSGVDRLVRETGLVLVRMEPETPEGGPPCLVHPFQLEVRGSFAGICAFMEGLERGLLLIPANWTIEPVEKEEGKLKASVRVKAHEWVGERILAEKGPEIPLGPLDLSAKRDPFSRHMRPVSVVTEKSQPPSLTGIMFIGGKAMAIIDGRPCGVGDTVRGKKIVSIEEERVFLEGEKKPLVLERPLKRVEEGPKKPLSSIPRKD